MTDRSVLKRQKLVKNAKIQKFNCDILSNFQTMWHRKNWIEGRRRLGILKKTRNQRHEWMHYDTVHEQNYLDSNQYCDIAGLMMR